MSVLKIDTIVKDGNPVGVSGRLISSGHIHRFEAEVVDGVVVLKDNNSWGIKLPKETLQAGWDRLGLDRELIDTMNMVSMQFSILDIQESRMTEYSSYDYEDGIIFVKNDSAEGELPNNFVREIIDGLFAVHRIEEVPVAWGFEVSWDKLTDYDVVVGHGVSGFLIAESHEATPRVRTWVEVLELFGHDQYGHADEVELPPVTRRNNMRNVS